MKTFDLFIVELEKTVNDTIKTESGLELFIETKFENSEFDYRVTQGPVVAVPFKYDTGVSVGDTLYFHHLVVMQEGQVLTGVDNHYFVQYQRWPLETRLSHTRARILEKSSALAVGHSLSLSKKKRILLICWRWFSSQKSSQPRGE